MAQELEYPTLNTNCQVPIYGAVVHLVVSTHANDERILMGHLSNENDYASDWEALCTVTDDGQFGIFFYPESIDHGLIAHEVFHLTHKILEMAGDTFTKMNHEAYAYLCQWLTDWVYAELDKGNVEVLQ